MNTDFKKWLVPRKQTLQIRSRFWGTILFDALSTSAPKAPHYLAQRVSAG
jgi:hypothetical protein